MKKLFIACCIFAASISSLAGDIIPIYSVGHDPIKIGNNLPRMPKRPMYADLSNNVLTLPFSFEEDVPVELLNEDGDVVYTDYLLAGQTSITLPSTLTGEYTLRLTVGNYYYIGIVEL